ncbi:hypothetical protein [Duganella sp. FT27W]|nr:hypothetical protein [Duganella sp. FT27W]
MFKTLDTAMRRADVIIASMQQNPTGAAIFVLLVSIICGAGVAALYAVSR